MTAIEWTHIPGFKGETWNPFVGCSVVSPGCTNCYAMRLAGTRLKDTPRYTGLTNDTKAGPVWNGQLRFDDMALSKPLRWRKPRAVFVNSMSDIFHEAVPDEWIDKVFSVMQKTGWHRFMILTKRPDRAKAYLTELYTEANGNNQTWFDRGFVWPLSMEQKIPFDNVWLGVSAEDQQRADERIPILLETPAAKRFVSCEPLLGPISFSSGSHDYLNGWTVVPECCGNTNEWGTCCGSPNPIQGQTNRLDWVIVGGESGPNRRPMDLAWARSIRDQCQSAGVPFFFKQIDKKQPIPDDLMIREWPKGE